MEVRVNFLKKWIATFVVKYVIDYLAKLKMWEVVKVKPALLRGIRVAVVIILSGVVATYGETSWYMALAPILSAVGKYLREKYGWTWLPI